MTTDSIHRYIIAYDIADDRRRDHVAKYLQRYGDRVQFSVFMCELGPVRFLRLNEGIKKMISELEDSILVCDLGTSNSLSEGRLTFIGVSRYITPSTAIVV